MYIPQLLATPSCPAHRYIQLLIFTLIHPSSYDMSSLRRDSALMRFLHSFFTSAPLAVVQLYVILGVAQNEPLHTLTTLPHLVVIASLGASIVSLLLTLFIYIGSDRLHSNSRRVVFPAYVTTFFWHFFVVPSRVASLALFAVAHGPYIVVVIGVHWMVAAAWTLFERTNLCGDHTKTPKKRRLHLEIPFVIVLSFIFTFVYFNLREGSTLTRIVTYHLATSVETIIIASLFYIYLPSLGFAPWAFSFTVGGYTLGMSFMALYYAAWHPKRTTDCFRIGLPHACDCCKVFHKSDRGGMGNVDLPLDNVGRQSSTPSTCSGPTCSNNNSGTSAGGGVIPINVSDLMTAVPSSIANSSGNGGYSHPIQSTPLGHRYLIGGGGERNERRGDVPDAPQLRHSSGSQYAHYSHLDPPPSGRRRSASPSGPTATPSGPPLPPGRRHTFHGGYTPERQRALDADPSSLPRGTSRSVHLPRRQNWRYSEGNMDVNNIVPTAHLAHFGINNQLYNLPSPIGEEPATPTGMPGGNRNLSLTPVVQVNGISYQKSESPGQARSVSVGGSPIPGRMSSYTPIGTRRSASVAEGRIQLDPPPHVAHAQSFSRNQPERHSGRIYAEIRDYARGSLYDGRMSRQGSSSPTRPGGSNRSSRHGSPRATNGTPRNSPRSSQRRTRHPSNPLHTHDPMQEFTKLYSTPTHGNYGVLRKPPPKRSSSPTGEDTEGSQRATSTSSSHLVSSDNYSDAYIVDDFSSESGRLTRKSSQHSDASTIPISACTTILSTSPSLSLSLSKDPQPHLADDRVTSRTDHVTSRMDHMTSRTDRMTCQSDVMLLRPTFTSHTLTGTLV